MVLLWWTYNLRHWFTKYGIASGLHIVLRYRRPESLPVMLVAGRVLLAVCMPVVDAGSLLALPAGSGLGLAAAVRTGNV